MKRTLLLLAIFLSVCVCFGNNGHSERIIKRIEGKLYVVENDINYKVDETRVIAKLKPQRQFPKIICDSTQELGFGIIEISVPTGTKVEDFLSLIKRTDDFEFVDYNTLGKYSFTPNDSLIGNQIGYQWHLDKIKAYDAWDITTGDPSIKVAVLDSGVDSCHYDLHYGIDNYTHLDIPNGYYYPDNMNYKIPSFYHGTMVAGIIGAKTHNARGIAGVSGGSYSTGISIIPFCVGAYAPYTNYVISAISRAIEKGANIINMSLSIAYNEGIESAINAAYSQGITIICSTGNDYSSSICFPASHLYTIAVGATNLSNDVADFSNYGYGIDIVAPGRYIISTSLNNGYYTDSGNSFAAPQVSGVVALMLSVNPNLSPAKIKEILRKTCYKIPGYYYNSVGWEEHVGYGLLDAHKSVLNSLYISGPTIPCGNSAYSVDNLPSSYTVTWSWENPYNPALSSDPTLQQNTPSTNMCTISNSSQLHIHNTLVATIYKNNIQVATLKKEINTGSGFSTNITGTYNGLLPDGMLPPPDIQSTTICDNDTLNATGGYELTMTSDAFSTHTVSYTGSAVRNWTNYGNGTIFVKLQNINSSSYVTVYGTTGCQHFQFRIYAFRNMFLSLREESVSISTTGKLCTVRLDCDAIDSSGNVIDSEEVSKSSIQWHCSVINVLTGTTVLENDVEGILTTFDLSKYPSGVYVIKVEMDDQTVSKKISI